MPSEFNKISDETIINYINEYNDIVLPKHKIDINKEYELALKTFNYNSSCYCDEFNKLTTHEINQLIETNKKKIDNLPCITEIDRSFKNINTYQYDISQPPFNVITNEYTTITITNIALIKMKIKKTIYSVFFANKIIELKNNN
jgi:hypothetical protein